MVSLVVARVAPSATYIAVNADPAVVLSLVAVIVSRLRGARIYLHYHSWPQIEHGRFPVLADRIAGSPVHIVLCRDMEENLRRRLGDASQIRVLGNGWSVDDGEAHASTLAPADRDRLSERPLSVGFLGRFVDGKGLDVALRVAARVADARPCRLVVAGVPVSEEQAARVREEVEALGGRYMGTVDDHSRPEFFSDLDILLFPSTYRNEAYPLVLVEALRSGVPVLATDVGCIRSMIDDDSWVCPPTEFEEWAVRRLVEVDERDLELASVQAVRLGRSIKQTDDAGLAALVEEVCRT